jgi:hypothetical protein
MHPDLLRCSSVKYRPGILPRRALQAGRLDTLGVKHDF